MVSDLARASLDGAVVRLPGESSRGKLCSTPRALPGAPRRWPPRRRAMKRLTVKIAEGDDVLPQLARSAQAGRRPLRGEFALHFDHCGGNEFFRFQLLVQRASSRRRAPDSCEYSPSPILRPSARLPMLDGEHESSATERGAAADVRAHAGHSRCWSAPASSRRSCARPTLITRKKMDRDVSEDPLNPSVMSSRGPLRSYGQARPTMLYGTTRAVGRFAGAAPSSEDRDAFGLFYQASERTEDAADRYTRCSR